MLLRRRARIVAMRVALGLSSKNANDNATGIQQANMKWHSLFWAALAGGMFVVSSGVGRADTTFNQFDSPSEVAGWSYVNFNGSPGSISWSTNNAPGTGGTGSGSMEMQITYDSVNEYGCAFISSTPAVDFSGATFVEFDLMVDPASPLDPYGNVFFFQLGFNSPSFTILTQFWLGNNGGNGGVAFTPGVWQHFNIAIPPGLLTTNEAQLFINPFNSLYANATPIVYIDNIKVDTFDALSVAVQASSTNILAGSADNFTGTIVGINSLDTWDFGDGTVVSNQLNVTHSWAAVGDYPVVFTAYNDSNPTGVSATVTVHVRIPVVHYVDLNSANPLPPYTNWLTAATNIQDAVDVSLDADQILVTNGIYQTGGRLVSGDSTTNRLAVTDAVTVQSINGPAVTVIQGYQVPGTTNGPGAMRCVYLANNASLIGFTLTNGATQTVGGGVECQSISAVVSNCVVVRNTAVFGGGASSGTFYNCAFLNNIAQNSGGGGFSSGYTGGSSGNPLVTYRSSFNNCLFRGNAAASGGAVAAESYDGVAFVNNCTIYGNSASFQGGGLDSFTTPFPILFGPSFMSASNCIVYGNTAPTGSNYFASGILALNYCCVTPLPASGIGNFTNDPALVNPAGGDFHLQSNSPCINSGNNASVVGAVDLDGNPRIVGGTVDIGAYEFQTPTSVISYAWLQQYGLPTDGSADFIDSDGDGMNNRQEWRAGTSPIDASSVLKMLTPAVTNNPSGLMVSWQSVTNITYYLQSSTNLGTQPAFTTIQSNIIGHVGTTSYTDTTATNGGPYFYRVGVP
jgi:hypothetical protein